MDKCTYIGSYALNSAYIEILEKTNQQLSLTKEELAKLAQIEQDKDLTLHPISLYIKNNLVKCEVGLCKKLQKHDKREKVKEEISRREMRLKQ